MQILLPVLYCILFLYCIYTHPACKQTGLSFRLLSSLFIIKLVASVAMYYIYTVYYPVRNEADLFKYFDDALHIFSSGKESPIHFLRFITGIDIDHIELQKYFDQMNFWDRKYTYGIGNDNRTIIRANALIMLFSWGNIWVHNVFASFISFISYLMIYRVFVKFAPQLHSLLIFSIFLIPSSIFWTSSMLKETIVMFGIAHFFFGIYALTNNRISVKNIGIISIGIVVLVSIKIYVLVAIIPAAIAYIISQKNTNKPVWHSYILAYTGMFLVICINQIAEFYPILEIFAFKRNDFITNTLTETNAQSYISIGYIQGTVSEFIQETPHALYRAIFLPWIWDVSSFIQCIPAVEKFLIIILLLVSIIFHKKQTREITNLIWFSGAFALGTFWIIGITTPVVGAIVRYTVPILPFLYTIFVLSIDWKQIFRKLNYGRKTI